MISVLLIDDDPIINLVHRKFLEKSTQFYTITVTNSAVKALDLLREWDAAGEPLPNLLLLDIMMPILDGFGFLQRFEELPDSIRGKVRIVMLTSSLDPRDKDKSVESPYVVGFIDKPLDKWKMEQLVELAR
jgi:CheY-like chemotaxis protein